MAGRPSPFWAHPGRTRYRCAAAAPCHPRGPGLPGAGTCRPARRYTWHVPPVDLGWTLADPPRTGRTGPPDRQTNTHAARIVTLGEQLAVTRWYARTETHSSRYRPTTTSGLACGSGLIENFRPDSPTTRSQPRGARGGARRPGGSRPAPSRRGSPGTLRRPWAAAAVAQRSANCTATFAVCSVIRHWLSMPQYHFLTPTPATRLVMGSRRYPWLGTGRTSGVIRCRGRGFPVKPPQLG